jgi:hypothetical protein
VITYYDDDTVRVTSDAIRVAGRSYPLPTLARVWHRRGPRSWRALAGRGALGAALLGPVAAALLGLVLAWQIAASAATTVALVGVACLIGLAAGPAADLLLEYLDRSYARGARDLEIWAVCGGRPVLLLRTRDALRFGQIYRALQRALEIRPAPKPAGGPPARKPVPAAQRPSGNSSTTSRLASQT